MRTKKAKKQQTGAAKEEPEVLNLVTNASIVGKVDIGIKFFYKVFKCFHFRANECRESKGRRYCFFFKEQ